MRTFVLLHSTNIRGTKTAYTKFRKYLIHEGFLMFQAKVYMKVTSTRKGVDKVIVTIQTVRFRDASLFIVFHKMASPFPVY